MNSTARLKAFILCPLCAVGDQAVRVYSDGKPVGWTHPPRRGPNGDVVRRSTKCKAGAVWDEAEAGDAR